MVAMPTAFDLRHLPHRRYNPLTREWILVSPHRTARPWHGQVEKTVEPAIRAYEPDCYLCPRNARAGGRHNPDYTGTFAFDNDFAALLPDTPGQPVSQDGLLVAQGEPGVCRVICFSPRHDLTLARMEPEEIRNVVDAWTGEYRELGGRPSIGYVQIFENRGAMMGASNPHPHCQIWASANLPNEVTKEQAAFRDHGSCLLCEYFAVDPVCFFEELMEPRAEQRFRIGRIVGSPARDLLVEILSAKTLLHLDGLPLFRFELLWALALGTICVAFLVEMWSPG